MIDKLLVKISGSVFISPKTRQKILNKRIGHVSKKVERINSNCYFRGNRIYIEDGVFINICCQFFSHEKPGSEIKLGKNVFIGMGVSIITHTHEIGNCKQRAGKILFKPVTVGMGTWIGANSIILPGVTIGSGCIIAAGSVVIKNCKSNCMYAGNPARKIKNII